MPILVLGDFFKDVWVEVHQQTRVNPEAPNAPIYTLGASREYQGGAGNVANTLKKYGASVVWGLNLGRSTQVLGPWLPTKTRYHNFKREILWRVDTMDFFSPIPNDSLENYLNLGCEVIVVSDYAKGSIDAEAVNTIGEHLETSTSECRLVVDTKANPKRWANWPAPITFTPNEKEFSTYKKEYLEVLRSCSKGDIVVTLGARGADYYTPTTITNPVHLDVSPNSKPTSVCGCGDMVVVGCALKEGMGGIKLGLNLASFKTYLPFTESPSKEVFDELIKEV